jgi:hypothetical protein
LCALDRALAFAIGLAQVNLSLFCLYVRDGCTTNAALY